MSSEKDRCFLDMRDWSGQIHRQTVIAILSHLLVDARSNKRKYRLSLLIISRDY